MHEDPVQASLNLAYDMAFAGMGVEEIEERIAERHSREEEVLLIMYEVEDYVVSAQLAMQARDSIRGHFIGGLAICLIGALISLYSMLSWQNEFILAYGAILFGAWYAWKNYRELRKPLDNFVPRTRQMGKRFRPHG